MFKLYCDRCQDFIKMLKQRELSDFKRDDPIICDQCKRTETQMNQMIERMRDQVKVLVEKVIADAKTKLGVMLTELTEQRRKEAQAKEQHD